MARPALTRCLTHSAARPPEAPLASSGPRRHDDPSPPSASEARELEGLRNIVEEARKHDPFTIEFDELMFRLPTDKDDPVPSPGHTDDPTTMTKRECIRGLRQVSDYLRMCDPDDEHPPYVGQRIDILLDAFWLLHHERRMLKG